MNFAALRKKQTAWGCFILLAAMAAALRFLFSPAGKTEQLKIVCGDPAAALVMRSLSSDLWKVLNGEYVEFSDCCGSQAQFSMAAGEVTAAVLCPDAAASLTEQDSAYVILGPVTLDTYVVVRRPNDRKALRTFGYMNQREEQARCLRENYGSGISLVPMFPAALGYALENGAVDAVVMDVLTALKLGYPMKPLSHDMVTSVMAVRRDKLNDSGFLSFLSAWNAQVDRLSAEDIRALVRRELSEINGEEAGDLWMPTTMR